MARDIIWVIDTSSVVQIRRSVENTKRKSVFDSMSTLVDQGRIVFPKQVVDELERVADPQSPDAQYQWAKRHEGRAAALAPSLEEVKNILATVPKVLDPDKDAGVEEADPYLLAIAVSLRVGGKDARIVTEELRETPRKMSLNTACGLVGVPSVPLEAFLRFEEII